MDESCVGCLPQEKNNDIKRKRKIQYRKTKGRLTTKSSGILNRSIYKTHNKSLNESKSDRSQAPRVSIQNINSFLSKNRELAKALEDCRQLTKSLENEKFTYQMECIQMREKLGNFQNAILKCNCNTIENNLLANNVDILFNLKNNITRSVTFLEDYLSTIANLKTEGSDEPLQAEFAASKQTNEIGIQTYFESDGKKQIKKMKNKKLQVNLMAKTICSSCSTSDYSALSSAEKPSKTLPTFSSNKAIQCNLLDKRDKNSVAIQCSLVETKNEEIKSSMKKKSSSRQPLGLLNQTNTPTLSRRNTQVEKSSSIPKLPFKIYSDDKEADKENLIKTKVDPAWKKRVTICSQPVKVHYYDVLSPLYDRQLRPRKAYLNYNESGINKLYKNNDKNDASIQPARIKVKKKKSSYRQTKKRKNPTIAIEDLISLVEESFVAGQASTKI